MSLETHHHNTDTVWGYQQAFPLVFSFLHLNENSMNDMVVDVNVLYWIAVW